MATSFSPSLVPRPSSLVPLLLLLAGCRTGTLPDPNDPATPGAIPAEVVRSNAQAAAEAFFARSAKGEIPEAEAKRLYRAHVDTLLKEVDPKAVSPGDAWCYAEVLLAAERWADAKPYLETAVQAAPNEDRRVNDSLRLARALAHLGDAAGAIRVARTVFDTPPQEKVPLLTAVLYEIAPPARGKGQDPELARLLHDAADQAMQAVVDENSDAGKMFLLARPTHVRRALRLADELGGGGVRI